MSELTNAGERAIAIRRLQAFMDECPAGMCLLTGEDLLIAAANEPIAAMWGRDRGTGIGKPLLEVLPELKGQVFEEIILNVLRTHEMVTLPAVPALLMHNGELRKSYYKAEYKPYFDEDGTLLGVMSIATEVTELVEARLEIQARLDELTAQTRALDEAQRLAEAGRLLQRVFEQSPLAVCVMNATDFRVDLMNPRFGEMVDRDPVAALGQPFFDLLPETRGQGYEEMLSQVLASGESVTINDHPVILKRQGLTSTGYFDSVYRPYRDQDDQIVGVTALVVEVTAQHEARTQLAAVAERFRQLTNGLPHMTWSLSPDGTIDYRNDRWWEYTGQPREEAVSRDTLSYLHPEEQAAVVAAYAHALQTGESLHHEHRIRHHDGQFRWHFVQTVPLRDSTGAIERWVGTATDIHELREAEREMVRLSAELEDSNRDLNTRNIQLANSNARLQTINSDLDSFVYTASHDLKAPITNIQGLQQLLRDEIADTELARNLDAERVLDMIDVSLVRFMNTINDLADIARVQRGDQDALEAIDIPSVVDAILLDLAPEIKRTQATFTRHFDDCRLFPFAPKNIRSVIYNLLSNALKYRDPSRAPEITLTCGSVDGHQVLTVADNGLGMDLRGDHKLFNIFTRLHDHVEGTGVGLHIVKRILENNGGRIEVDSTVGVGSTFRVYVKNKR